MTLFNKINNMDISDKSKDIYKRHLIFLNNGKEPTSHAYLNSFKKINKKLDELSTVNKINHLSSIMVVLPKDKTAYKKYYEMKGKLLKERIEELKAFKENNKREYATDIKDEQMNLLHELCKYLPRRCNDWHNLIFYDGGKMNPEYNYITKNDNGKYILIFNKYKTSSLYNTQVFDFPIEVLPLFEKYLENPEVISSTFVFGFYQKSTNNIQPYVTPSGLSLRFEKATGLTFNDMRHMYAEKHCKELTDDIDEHLSKLAHSYNTNIYYQIT